MSEPSKSTTEPIDGPDSGRTAAIELRAVDIGYGGDPVVRGVSLTVAQREIHVLLGESGSGKTTILRALAGFERVSAGEITLFGESVDSGGHPRGYRPPEQRGVGVVFQDYALFPHLNVAGNIAFGMNRRDAEEVNRQLERVGLPDLGGCHVSELSGGQQQRVALARALAQKPRIIVLDEPFSNLNRQLRDELRQNTADVLRADGITAIFVTHDRHEAFALADRISVVGDGQILQTGTCRDIYERPASEAVASSVGDVSILSATVDDSGTLAGCALGRLPVRSAAEPRAATRVMLRPEQVQIISTTAGAHTGDDDTAEHANDETAPRATVERVVYHGAMDEVRLCLDEGEALIAYATPGRVEAGDVVRVGVRGDVVCLPSRR